MNLTASVIALSASLITPQDQLEAEVSRLQPSVILPDDEYALTWRDEFEGDALDESKWSHSRLGPRRDAINVQEAVLLDGEGHLRITTTRHEKEDGTVEYHTGMIDTRGKFDTTYGFFECRMKLQSQVGHWSAFWLMPPTMGDHIGEPAKAGAEIDVIEYLCNEDNGTIAHHALHWDGYGEDHKSEGERVRIENLNNDEFHTFSLLWSADEYVFYVDGKETWRTDTAVSQREEYMILSVEVEEWAGDIAHVDLPDGIVVDWVRAWQKASE